VLTKTDHNIRYIDTDATLKELISQLSYTDDIALDTEADSLHHYFEKVCLIQISSDGGDYLIDPLSSISLTPLFDILSTKSLIIHGADYDLRMLRTSFGFRPKAAVFDTMIAAKILGYEHFGLAALIERFFGSIITKQGQKSDWSQRPLTPMQLDYARNDTRFLESLARHMRAEMAKVNRCEWHREACQSMVISTGKDTVRDLENLWRIKNSGGCTQRELAYLRELWHWRDKEARQIDKPPFKVLNNQKLLAITIWASAASEHIFDEHTPIPRHMHQGRLGRLKTAIQKAATLPEGHWPPLKKSIPHKRRFQDNTPDIDALRKASSSIAKKLSIDSSVLAPKAALASIIQKNAKTLEEIITHGPLLPWQAKLLEPALNRIVVAREERERLRNILSDDPMPSSPPPATDVTST